MNSDDFPSGESLGVQSARAKSWADTMGGFAGSHHIVDAHQESKIRIFAQDDFDRPKREQSEDLLNGAAARSLGGGRRAHPEPADPYRGCFEKDRDRILHSPAFRRLAGKTQVFIFPKDHQRTRLTHALEVSQVARAISKRLGLNQDLTEAIALGHDCGHGPGGHASEDALSIFLEGGYDHATIGANRILVPLNLCEETLDGVRNHSWSRPEPATAEGLVVSWADRIAYCAHDLEDAIGAGIVEVSEVPSNLREAIGVTRSSQLDFFINAMVSCARETGRIAMYQGAAEKLSELRSFNYHAIYLRPESLRQSMQVISVLRQLVEYLASKPDFSRQLLDLPQLHEDENLLEEIVIYVGGMTDRYAFAMARELLGIENERIPIGIDILS